MARVVVQRPDWGDFACKWGSWWLNERVIKSAVTHGYTVSDLYGSDATRNKVLKECKKSDFVYFSGVGHGNSTTFTGQYQERIFWRRDEETKKISKGKHFNFLSCRFGRFGARWMKRVGGAVGVHAYNADFVFLADSDDFPNGYAEPFFDAHTTVDRELLRGATHGEAHRACKKRYAYWILNAPFECRRYLVWDMMHKVFHGDRNRGLKGGGCFIATATLGESEDLQTFYWLRDEVMSKSRIGRLFVGIYYRTSPPLAEMIAKSNSLRMLSHTLLITPLERVIKRIKNFN
jgi:hypothetical protein